MAGTDIEITVWSVNATTPPEPVDRIAATDGGATAKTEGSRRLFDAACGGFVEAQATDRMSMETGQRVRGPVAVTEAETTIIVPASCDAIRQPDGCIDVVLKE